MALWLVHPPPDRVVGDIAFCSWARYVVIPVPLSSLVYKWVPASLILGGNLRWISMPSSRKGEGGRVYNAAIHIML